MTDQVVRGAFDELEAQLGDLAATLAFPPTPNLAAAVGARLRTPADPPRFRFPPLPRSVRRSLLLAAVLTLAIVGGALAVRLGLELLSIERGPVPTAPLVTPNLDLGRSISLEDATAEADFDVLVPDWLGQPNAVYLGDADLRGQVAFVYAPRDGVPGSELLDGAGLLVTQNVGRPDDGLAHKIVETSNATVESVAVDGAPGVWISGDPHVFWYEAPDGTFINESRRVVGDTLVWERDGILYRIEGSIPLQRALEIARSMR